jgi:hypothetical protein
MVPRRSRSICCLATKAAKRCGRLELCESGRRGPCRADALWTSSIDARRSGAEAGGELGSERCLERSCLGSAGPVDLPVCVLPQRKTMAASVRSPRQVVPGGASSRSVRPRLYASPGSLCYFCQRSQENHLREVERRRSQRVASGEWGLIRAKVGATTTRQVHRILRVNRKVHQTSE